MTTIHDEFSAFLLENPDIKGWVGTNKPGPIEELSGVWVTQASAWRSQPHEWEESVWGPLEAREWGTVISGGGLSICIDGKIHKVGPGQWYTFPARLPVAGSITRDTTYVFMSIAGFREVAYAAACGWSEDCITVGNCSREVSALALDMAKALHEAPPDAQVRVHVGLMGLLHTNSSSIGKNHIDISPEISRVVAMIDDNPGGRRIDATHLASLVFMGVVTLRKRFAREVGMPITRYWTYRKLQLTKHLLAGTQLPIADIAEMAGFGDSQHFCHLFRRHEGMSAGEYRSLFRRKAGPSQV